MTEAPVEMCIRVYWIPLLKPRETFAQVLTFLPGLSKESITNKIKKKISKPIVHLISVFMVIPYT